MIAASHAKIYVPATCPIGGHDSGFRRTALEAILALTCGLHVSGRLRILSAQIPKQLCSVVRTDLSKLARAPEAAVTDAGVWADDARVVGYERLAKVFLGEDPGTLHVPGVRVVVGQVTE